MKRLILASATTIALVATMSGAAFAATKTSTSTSTTTTSSTQTGGTQVTPDIMYVWG